VRIARENTTRNGVRDGIRVRCLDLLHQGERLRGGFSVVCANLMFALLLSQRDRIIETVAPGGRLILSGILRREFLQLRRAYEPCGLKLVAHEREAEWESGAFVRG
jgi:ribosomal protein L11 methyltransferase